MLVSSVKTEHLKSSGIISYKAQNKIWAIFTERFDSKKSDKWLRMIMSESDTDHMSEESLKSVESFESPELRDRIAAILQLLLREMSHCDGIINVKYIVGEHTTVYSIEMPVGSKARVIGQGGRNINAIRSLVSAMGGANGIRAIVDLVI